MKSSAQGQSLVEVMVAIAVGVILIGGAAAIMAPTLLENKQVGSTQAQTELADELSNNVKAWAASGWNNVLALATGTTNTYFLNTAASPFTAATSSTSAAGYSYYRTITVTANASIASGTLTSFPMLVSSTLSAWEPVSKGGHIQNLTTAPNGGQEPADLIFSTSSSCSSPLNFETESYASSTGALVDWVNVPTMQAGTVIYVCYGNSLVTTDQSHPSLAWNSNFTGVWHLDEATAATSKDSTANSANATPKNSPTQTAGQINNALSFSAPSSQYDDTGLYLSSFMSAATGSIEAWIKTNGNNVPDNGDAEDPSIFQDGDSGSGGYIWLEVSNDTTLLAGGYDIANREIQATIPANTWTQVEWIHGGGTLTMYVNGVAANSMTLANISTMNGAGVNFGLSWAGQYFSGGIDEVEVLNAALSSQWILTEYNNQGSPSTFYTVGSETAGSGGGSSGPVGMQQITLGHSTYNRYFYLTDSYRNSQGNVTTTASGNSYDPSTKFVTVVVVASSTNAVPTTYRFYLSRAGTNSFSQTSWSGGSGQTTPLTVASATYAAETNVTITASGTITLVSGGGCVQ